MNGADLMDGCCPMDGVDEEPGVLVVRACACVTCAGGETCEAAVVARYPGADPANLTALELLRAAHPGCELVY